MREDKYCNDRYGTDNKKSRERFYVSSAEIAGRAGIRRRSNRQILQPLRIGHLADYRSRETGRRGLTVVRLYPHSRMGMGLRPAVRTTESAAAFRHDHRARPLFVGPDRPRTPETFRDHRLTGEAHLLYIGTINTCRLRYT